MGEGEIDPRALLEALPETVLVVSGEEVVFGNAAATAWLGYASLDGLPLADILASGEAERFARLVGQRDAGWPLPASVRLGFRRRGGEELKAEIRLSSLPTGERVLSARDVTDVTRAEHLMGNLALLSGAPALLAGPNALLDASAQVFDELGWTVAFVEMTRGGSTTRRVISPAESPIGAYGRALVGVELPLARTPVVAEVMRAGKALFLDDVPLLLDGPTAAALELSRSMIEAKVARNAWCPIHDGERVSHVLAVTGKDLTDHDFVAVQLFAAQLGASLRLLRLSTALVRRERLAAVGEMAAVLAHEVRSPIGVMFNALGLMKRAAAGPDHERLMEMLSEEAQRLKQLVSDLLDFAGPNTSALEPVDIAPVVRAALEAARTDAAFQEKTPRVVLDLDGVSRPVRGSATLLRRALINLLQNAFQHVPHGLLVRVQAAEHGDGARIRVYNEGTAIEPAVAARIFEPFFTTEARGTGLGLAIVRRIAVELGGHVHLEPTSDGVTFALDLAYA
jgi:signal transduction histidine kinase